MRQLEQAKTAFPNTYLMVGVTGDHETHMRKGLTVLSARERAETVRHCRWVDEVLEDCPWIVTPEFLSKHRIDYVAHDDIPYGALEGDDIYGPIKREGRFLVTQRTEGVSTTGIITKIVRDYEQYISRQLRRGASRQELNISWLKKNELDLKHHVAELRDSIKHNWSSAGHEVGRDLRQLLQPSRTSSPAPPRTGALVAPGGERATADFAHGYTLGLVGGIRSWMQRNRRNVRSINGSRPTSPMESDEEGSATGGKHDAHADDGDVDDEDVGRHIGRQLGVES